jgi:fructosamine-3-kinase
MKLAMAATWKSCWNDQQGEEQTYSNYRASKPVPLGWKTRAFDISDTYYLMSHHQLYR